MEIILIPGMWLSASAWDAVVPALEKAGHRAHPLTLPGMESKAADRSKITLQDLVGAVVAAIDGADGPVAVVGHSMGGGLAHAATDARVDRVAHVVYVDSWPTGDGGHLNSGLPVENGEVPLPDWSAFDDEDLVDLDDSLRTEFRERAIPWPGLVSRDPVQLTDERRYDVPSTLIACEFSSAQLREWTASGESNLQELAKLRANDYIDLPTGHWPMLTKPAELGDAIVRAVSRA